MSEDKQQHWFELVLVVSSKVIPNDVDQNFCEKAALRTLNLIKVLDRSMTAIYAPHRNETPAIKYVNSLN